MLRDESDFVYRDTIIQIGNDFPRGVQLKCFWVDKWQSTHDFSLNITLNQPIWFKASDGIGSVADLGVAGIGDGNATGELKCWAVNFSENNQVVWNHLNGSAIIFDTRDQTAYEYSAYAFTARTTVPNPEFANFPPPGILNLTGLNNAYDACPAYLLFNFFASNDDPTKAIPVDQGLETIRFGKSDLTLVPCKQDLRQDRLPTCTKAKFDIWNENERKLTGAYQCIKCWFEGTLDEIGYLKLPYSSNKVSGFGGDFFTRSGLHSDLGRVRITGIKSTPVCKGVFVATDPVTGKLGDVCVGPNGEDLQVNTPLLGVLSTEISLNETPWKTFGITATTAGAYVPAAGETVQIQYDIAPTDTPQSPGR